MELKYVLKYVLKMVLKFPTKQDEYLAISDDELNEDLKERTVGICLAEVPDEIDIDGDVSWDINNRNCLIKPKAKLNSTQSSIFISMTTRIKKYVANSIQDLGRCKIFKRKIKTIDEDPIYIPAYRNSQTEREEINKQVE